MSMAFFYWKKGGAGSGADGVALADLEGLFFIKLAANSAPNNKTGRKNNITAFEDLLFIKVIQFSGERLCKIRRLILY